MASAYEKSAYGGSSGNTDAFSSSYGNSVYGAPAKASGSTIDQELVDLKTLAKLAGKKDVEKEQSTFMSVLERTGRVLNYDIANISGIALGAMRDDITWQEGRRLGVARNTGFADVYKEMLGQPETRVGKLALGTAGFVSDVFLSPLTYLTLGTAGIAKTISKTGTKVAISKSANKAINTGSKELIEAAEKRVMESDLGWDEIVSHADELAKEGMDPIRANSIAQKIAKDDIEKLTESILTKSGKGELGAGDFEELIKKGLSSKSAENIMQLGGQIIDRGGIQFAGKVLVSSETLAKTPIGKALNRLGEFSVIQTLGKTFGKMFVADAFKDKKLVEIFDTANREKRREFTTVVNELNEKLGKLDETRQLELYRTGSNGMKETVEVQKQIWEDNITKLTTDFPELKGRIRNTDDANKLYDVVGDLSQQTEKELTSKIEARMAKEWKDKQEEVIKSGGVDVGDEQDLQRLILDADMLKKHVNEMYSVSAKPASAKLLGGAPEVVISDAERIATKEFLDTLHYEKLADEVNNLADRARRLLEEQKVNPRAISKEKSAFISKNKEFKLKQKAYNESLDVADAKVVQLKKEQAYWNDKLDMAKRGIGRISEKQALAKGHSIAEKLSVAMQKLKDAAGKVAELRPPRPLSNLDEIALLKRDLDKVQGNLSKQEQLLSGLIGARRAAKARTRKKIEYPNDKILQKAADDIWNNADSITARMAKLAGLDEQDVFHSYFPQILNDKAMVKDFVNMRHTSAIGRSKGDRLKMFEGALKEDQVITNPAEAFKTANLDLISSKIQAESMEAIFKAFGKQAEGMTEHEMKKIGFIKFTRNILGKEYSGYIPKEIKQEVDEFFEPRDNIIDEIAENLKFDWATSMFKSWSTAMFPAFQFLNYVGNQFNLLMKIGINSMNVPRFTETTNLAILSLPPDSFWRKSYVRAAKTASGFDEEKLLNQHFTTLDGRKITNRDFIAMVKKDSDILDSGLFNNYEQGIKEVGHRVSNNPLSLDWAAMHTAREFGQTWEIQAKLMAIQDRVISGGTVKEGIKDAEEAIFNYNKLTPFEKTYLRRIIPFYTFARKNLEFQLKMLSSNPGRVATQFKLLNNVNDSFGADYRKDEETGIPKYILNRMHIRAGSEDGKVMSGFGLPIEEFLGRFSGEKGFMWNTITNVLQQTNPLLKVPLERVTGQDLFRGRPIVEIDNGAGLKWMFDAMGGTKDGVGKEFAELIDYKEVKGLPTYDSFGNKTGTYTRYLANPIFLHWTRNLPSARLQNTVAKLNDEEVGVNERIAKFITGVQLTTVDAEKEAYFKKLREKEELSNWLVRMGVLKHKDIFYKPKNEAEKQAKKKSKDSTY